MFQVHHDDERTEFLRKVTLFNGLRRRQLRSVGSLMTGIDVPAGRTLCEAGRRGHEFFIIKDGEVEVSNGVVLGRGQFFGEMALLNDQPRSATVTATTPCVLLVLSRQEFAKLRDVDPHIGAELERVIRDRQPSASLARS